MNMITNVIPNSKFALAICAHAYTPPIASVSDAERNAHTNAAASTITILLIVELYPVRCSMEPNITSAE